jgi:NADP-dependent 3-hydroxy acid dehydrogenase YdfG
MAQTIHELPDSLSQATEVEFLASDALDDAKVMNLVRKAESRVGRSDVVVNIVGVHCGAGGGGFPSCSPVTTCQQRP